MSGLGRHGVLALAWLLTLVGCPAPEAPRPRAVAPAPVPAPPATRQDGRLPALASPTHYALAFDLDPTKPTFRARARLDLAVPADTHHVVLHGRDLAIGRILAEDASGQVEGRSAVRQAAGAKVADELVLSFSRPLRAGKATITIEYTAPFGVDLTGFYRVEDGGRAYAFSQLESTHARQVFPCFDEPSYKVPFDVELTVPNGMLAVANARETGREATKNGTRFTFATTKPLPTYLLAVAVGDLDVKEGTAPASTKIRVVTTKGKAAQGDYALTVTAEVLGTIERMLGVPYPYDKLDVVAVPDFAAGAMENAGLVTFREERLLVAKDAAWASRRSQALIMAHELAHQWFGDLVTAGWWTDLWLNEGMATWLEYRTLDKMAPAYGAKLDAVAAGLEAMELDALSAARAVREPVVSANDASAAFDDITYLKGGSVLATVGQYVGDDALFRGLNAYLEENAYKSVTTSALLSALDRASGKDVTRMASSFLDKPGVPDVSGERACTHDAWSVELTAEPYRPLGVAEKAEDARSWTFAVCATADKAKSASCTDLAEGAPSMVAGRGACPAWVHPNAGSAYYRFTIADAELVKLAQAGNALEPAQRMTLVSNAWSSVRSGRTRSPVLLKLLAALDADASRHVVDQITMVLGGMSDILVADDARPKFRAYVAKRLAKRKEALGWGAAGAKDGAAEADLALGRARVLAAMGDLAEDETTLREADAIAEKWLADPASVEEDVATIAVDLASRHAGRARFEALRKAAAAGGPPARRIVALRGLIGFDDPALIDAALALVVSGEIKPHELRYLLWPALERRTAKRHVEAFVRANWDALRKALPGGLSRPLVSVAGVACSAEEVAAMKAFYEPRAAEIEGASRRLAEALEASRVCAAIRESDRGALGTALLRWKD